MHTLDSPNDSASASVDMHVMRCPFCNSDSIRRGMNEHSHWLECSYCRAEGPAAQTPAKAILAWNRRTFAVVPPQANPQPDSGSLTPADEQTTAPVDTVSFVQEWLMTGDYAPDQWHRDFAAAIDGRAIKTAEANDTIAALTTERDRLQKALQVIASPLDCGCAPCTGHCRSQSALEIEVEARQEIARAALATTGGADHA